MAALPDIVSEEEWATARAELLEKEKATWRELDALAAERRRLPMVELTKEYELEGPQGTVRLLDLFEGRDTLVVYCYTISDGVQPCGGCSLLTDNLPHLSHLRSAGVSWAHVSRRPLAEIEQVKARLGFDLPWYADVAEGHPFVSDMGAWDPETGHDFRYLVFLRDGDRIFKTWSTTGRGAEMVASVWAILDSTPYGRRERWQDVPAGFPQYDAYWFWGLHDEYPPEVQGSRPHPLGG